MSDVTLTEFLLARIAEDEELATEWLDEAKRNGYDLTWPMRGPEYALADCEAKRRIVELHAYRAALDHPYRGHIESGNCWSCRGVQGPCPTLRALALPYADHSEYDEEWRP